MKKSNEELIVKNVLLADMLMETCLGGTGQSQKLGRAIMEAESIKLEQLQDQVFEYGSHIKESDYEDRSIFVCLVSMLRRMERQFSFI